MSLTGPIGWAPPMPSIIIYCPKGLEYLVALDGFFVRQEVEMLEVLFGCETNNRYRINNSYGQQIYFAQEDTDFCTRMCLGASRPFDLVITDAGGFEVLHMYRPFRCPGFSCIPSCLQEIEVISPPMGNMILGYVKQEFHCCKPKYVIQNAGRIPVLKIWGPICVCSCFGFDVDFKIYSLDETVIVGYIRKKWSGILREAFTDADNFGVSFPVNMDVSTKATILGAAFLIDYMYFEAGNNQ